MCINDNKTMRTMRAATGCCHNYDWLNLMKLFAKWDCLLLGRSHGARAYVPFMIQGAANNSLIPLRCLLLSAHAVKLLRFIHVWYLFILIETPMHCAVTHALGQRLSFDQVTAVSLPAKKKDCLNSIYAPTIWNCDAYLPNYRWWSHR